MGFSAKNKNAVHPEKGSTANGTSPNHVDRRSEDEEGAPYKPWAEEIEALKGCDEFFIKQTNKNAEVDGSGTSACHYDICNSKGKVLFKAIESVEPSVRDLYRDKEKPPYSVIVFDMKAGKEMLKINANLTKGVMLVYTKTTIADKILGIVRMVPHRYHQLGVTPMFTLERTIGSVLLKIQRTYTYWDLLGCAWGYGYTFRILMSDDVTHLGNIHYTRTEFEVKDNKDVEAGAGSQSKKENVVTATFPGDTTGINKALVLASLFLLDALYFRQERTQRRRFRISKTCYIVMSIVIFVIIVGIMAAVFSGGGYESNSVKGGFRGGGVRG